MIPTHPRYLISAGLLALSLLPAEAADSTADQLLKQMSRKLATAQSFTFSATREISPGLVEGMNLPEQARISVAVQRPDKISATASSKLGTRRFVFDGSSLVLLDGRNNCYSKTPMRGSIDGLVDQLDAKYGFVPPLAEFAVSNPSKEFHMQAKTVSYLGRAKSQEGLFGWFGEECDRKNSMKDIIS